MIDIEQLLIPISPADPCGPDLRTAKGKTNLDDVKSLRKDSGRSSDEPDRIKEVEWKKVVALCADALRSQSKDLELAIYLIEGLTRTDGLPGLLAGLNFLEKLILAYWDKLHPHRLGDEEAPELRLSHLNWLGSSWDETENSRGQFFASFAMVPLTVVTSVGNVARALTFGDALDAEMMELSERTDPVRHADLAKIDTVSMPLWKKAFDATPANRRATNTAIASECLEVLRRIDATVKAKCGEIGARDGVAFDKKDIPDFGALERGLLHVPILMQSNASSGNPDAAQSQGDAESKTMAGLGQTTESGRSGPIRTRHDATRQLKEIVAFLRATEPHSPVSYLIERAIHWLDLPFEDLLRDFVKTPETIHKVRELLGLPEESAQEGGETPA